MRQATNGIVKLRDASTYCRSFYCSYDISESQPGSSVVCKVYEEIATIEIPYEAVAQQYDDVLKKNFEYNISGVLTIVGSYNLYQQNVIENLRLS